MCSFVLQPTVIRTVCLIIGIDGSFSSSVHVEDESWINRTYATKVSYWAASSPRISS